MFVFSFNTSSNASFLLIEFYSTEETAHTASGGFLLCLNETEAASGRVHVSAVVCALVVDVCLCVRVCVRVHVGVCVSVHVGACMCVYMRVHVGGCLCKCACMCGASL